MIQSTVKRVGGASDAAVSGGLLTAQILRLAFSQSIAIYGLLLYMMNAERADLYGFVIVGLVALFVVRPSRDRWEAAFRWSASEYPGVSPSP
jgi:hypothetical protein